MAAAEGSGGDVYRLPEGCISHVISFTSPRDSCRSAVVSPTFRSAADSDTVWERFLPPDVNEILSRAVTPVQFSSKKDLYFRLCDSVLVDGGKLSFKLERSSGAKCYTLPARELRIAWRDAPEYWRWMPDPDSRFSEVAELLAVCWLEVGGKLDCRLLSPKTAYEAYLIFKTAPDSYGLYYPPQEALVKIGTHESKEEVCVLPDESVAEHLGCNDPYLRRRRRLQAPPDAALPRAPRARDDGWKELKLGDFYNDDGDDGEVEMSLMGVKGGWKKGLIVLGIEVRPKI